MWWVASGNKGVVSLTALSSEPDRSLTWSRENKGRRIWYQNDRKNRGKIVVRLILLQGVELSEPPVGSLTFTSLPHRTVDCEATLSAPFC